MRKEEGGVQAVAGEQLGVLDHSPRSLCPTSLSRKGTKQTNKKPFLFWLRKALPFRRPLWK